ncbi:MAG: lysylphosphatidylglycerol synthase domain-containing protein, partial [Acidobacteria bacterium]|nr:lysylphosphatidylglycerol synthase domain-containing protein [Acidobacteriota bacterium]
PLAVTLAVVAGGLTWALLFKPGIYERLLRLSGVQRFATIDRLARKFLAAAGQYGTRHGLVARVLTASIAVQVLRTLQTWCLGLALGLTVAGTWYFAAVPVIVLLVLLPISFAGLGTANVAFVYLFSLAGVPAEDAFILSLLFLALSVLGNLPGGLLFAVGGRAQRAA